MQEGDQLVHAVTLLRPCAMPPGVGVGRCHAVRRKPGGTGRRGCISAVRRSSVEVGVLCPLRVGRIRGPDAGVLLRGDHMAPFVVALGIAGVMLILVGLVGGGFTISTTAMPKVGNWVRVPCFGVGVVLVVAAVGLGFNNPNSPNPPNPPQSASPAAVVTVAAP